jgi:hypothetical protein
MAAQWVFIPPPARSGFVPAPQRRRCRCARSVIPEKRLAMREEDGGNAGASRIEKHSRRTQRRLERCLPVSFSQTLNWKGERPVRLTLGPTFRF